MSHEKFELTTSYLTIIEPNANFVESVGPTVSSDDPVVVQLLKAIAKLNIPGAFVAAEVVIAGTERRIYIPARIGEQGELLADRPLDILVALVVDLVGILERHAHEDRTEENHNNAHLRVHWDLLKVLARCKTRGIELIAVTQEGERVVLPLPNPGWLASEPYQSNRKVVGEEVTGLLLGKDGLHQMRLGARELVYVAADIQSARDLIARRHQFSGELTFRGGELVVDIAKPYHFELVPEQVETALD